MENIAYVALSLQTVLNRQMQITANNVANMSTAGYKAQGVLFNEELTKAQGEIENNGKLSMVLDHGTFRRVEQGPLQQTGNPLDLALEGSGFFAIDTANGTRYARAGNFSLDREGQIVTQNGNPVLSDGGQPITIPQGDTQIMIANDGTLSTAESGILGRIGVMRFDDEQKMLENGNGLYDANGEVAIPAENTNVLQFMLEGSNVQPILEMNKMIEIVRNYQQTQRLLQTDHERQRNVISRLTQNVN